MKSFGKKKKKNPRGYSLTFLNAFQKKKPSLNARLYPRMTNRPTFVTTT